MKIYVVDDNDDSRVLLTTALTYQGYQVECFSSGNDAYQASLQSTPDLIISDVLMPDIDGYEFCRKIKETPQLQEVPFIFCSGTYMEDRDEHLARDLGAVQYITKPIELNELIEMVKGVLINGKEGDTSGSGRPRIAAEDFDAKYTEVLSNKVYQKVQELEEQNQILAEKENELRLIANSIPEMLSEIGRDYQYKFVNKAYRKWHGVQSSQVVGRDVADVIGEEAFAKLEPHLVAAMNGEEISFETDYKLNNEYRCLLVRYIPIKDDEGAVSGIIALVNDISERKISEARMNNLNRALKVLGHCNEALIRADSEEELLNETCRVIVNEGGYYFAWVGYAVHNSSKDVRPIAISGHGEGYLDGVKISWGDNEFGRGPTGRAIRTGEVCSVMNIEKSSDYKIWRDEAVSRDFHSSIALPLSVEGHVIGALNIYSNEMYSFGDEAVTLLTRLADNISYGIQTLRNRKRRKQAESELRKSEKEFRNILDNMVDTYYRTDTEGHIVLVSPSVYTLLGYAPGELLGRNAEEFYFYPQEREKFLSTLRDQDGRVKGYEAQLRKKSGSSVWVSTSAKYHWDQDGNIAGVEGVVRDISENKAAGEEREMLYRQLQQAQKMEAIGQLTGGIAHDFNNILASILGYTGLALDRFVPEKESKLHDYLTEVYRAGERARDLVSQMLTFSRGGASSLQQIDVSEIIFESLKMLRPMIPSTVEITTDIGKDVPKINGDAVIIHQVIMNLCINARDAIDKHGTISIKLSLADDMPRLCDSCHKEIEGEYIDFSVSDNGHGMPLDVKNRIFEPFFSTKDTGKGTGMGLSMAHGIIHEHNGHIYVESSPGKGTNFHILLPITEAVESVAHEENRVIPWSDDSGQKNRRILLVDDEVAVGGFLRELLEAKGWGVELFSSSTEALDYFKSNADSIDLIVTDQTMPKMTGLEMASEILAIQPDLPIIVCSGYNEDIDEMNAMEQGVRGYITKPINSRKFLSKVSQLLNGIV